MIGKTELESLTSKSALGGRLARGFVMTGFLSKVELQALLAGAVRTAVIPGGAPGNLTVTGIDIGDALRAVLSLDVTQAAHPVHGHNITLVAPAGGGGAVTAPAVVGPLEQVGGPKTHPGAVDVLAAPQAHTRTWAVANLTAEFTITGANTINNAGGTDSTGKALIVVFEDLTP